MKDVLFERYDVLREIFGDVNHNQRNNEVLVFCPKHYHRKRKLSINISTNKYKCWVCGFAGNQIFTLLREHATRNQFRRYTDTLETTFEFDWIESETLSLPEGYQFVLSAPYIPIRYKTMKFLDELGVSRETIIQNKIGYCDEGDLRNRIIFPSFNMNGDLNYYISRALYDNARKKYLNCAAQAKNIIFNELFIHWNKTIIITESVKTHLRHFSVPNVIPLMGTGFAEDYKLFQDIVLNGCERVILALDPGTKLRAMALFDQLTNYGVTTQIAEFDRQPDKLSTNEFLTALAASKAYTKEDILREHIINA